MKTELPVEEKEKLLNYSLWFPLLVPFWNRKHIKKIAYLKAFGKKKEARKYEVAYYGGTVLYLIIALIYFIVKIKTRG